MVETTALRAATALFYSAPNFSVGRIGRADWNHLSFSSKLLVPADRRRQDR